MRRLREDDSLEPEVSKLAELVEAAQPLERSLERQQRVRRALAARDERRAAPWLILRPAVLLAVLIGSVALAGTIVGRRWLAPAVSTPAPTPAGHAPRGVRTPPAAPVEQTALPPSAPEDPSPGVAEEPSPTVEDEPTRSAAPSRVKETHPSPRVGNATRPAHTASARPEAPSPAPRPNAPPPQALPTGPPVSQAQANHEASLVAHAVKTLRTDGDAKRAQALLADYLARYPQGLLTEEALALSIEAAAARDDAQAGKLAKRYLGQYPRGRFRNVAEQAIERFAR